MKTVKIRISPDGSQFETEVEGVKGASCTDLTKGLLNALGTVEEDNKLPEFFLEEANTINTRI